MRIAVVLISLVGAEATAVEVTIGKVKVSTERGKVVCLFRNQRPDGRIEKEVELFSVAYWQPAGKDKAAGVPWTQAKGSDAAIASSKSSRSDLFYCAQEPQL